MLPVSILLLPSMRAVAYLGALRALGVVPESCILMEGDIPRLSDVLQENERHQYARQFFDVKLDIKEYLALQRVPTHCVRARNCNEGEVVDAVRQCRSDTLIYTGGGILKAEILGLGKQFIHVHPGLTPEYRGSTCFYYSLLQDDEVGATAFIMDAGVDTGAVIARQAFSVNYPVQRDQPLFMDYILDPYIRAAVLKKVGEIFLREGRIDGRRLAPDSVAPYHVMHPLLRHLTVRRLNARYDPTVPAGIFPKPNVEP